MSGLATTAAHLSRLLSLVPYLLAHPYARLPDVARTFGVTEKQLRRDLDLVFCCGLPGHMPDDLIDVHIEGDRISLTNAETIARPLRLTVEEALALLVGLRVLAGTRGPSDREIVDRLAAKLETAAGDAASSPPPGADTPASPVSSLVASAGERVTVAPDGDASAAASAAVADALARGRRLHLDYHVPGRDETTSRQVDPMRLLLVDGRSYLEGWCRRAEDVRLFRLDRVVDVRVLDTPAKVPPDAVPRDLSEGLYQPSPGDVAVGLELEPAGRWVAEYYPCETVTDLGEGRLHVTLRTPDTRWVRRLALRLGASGRVVGPEDLARAVQDDARAALSAYGKAETAAPG
jgi:proteasome accessory factor C